MKYLALLKIDDIGMAYMWHSGSTHSYKSKFNIETKEEANVFIENEIKNNESKWEGGTDNYGYRYTKSIIEYDETNSEGIEEFFKYFN